MGRRHRADRLPIDVDGILFGLVVAGALVVVALSVVLLVKIW